MILIESTPWEVGKLSRVKLYNIQDFTPSPIENTLKCTIDLRAKHIVAPQLSNKNMQIVMQRQLNYATAGLLGSVSCQAISLGDAPTINQCVY